MAGGCQHALKPPPLTRNIFLRPCFALGPALELAKILGGAQPPGSDVQGGSSPHSPPTSYASVHCSIDSAHFHRNVLQTDSKWLTNNIIDATQVLLHRIMQCWAFTAGVIVGFCLGICSSILTAGQHSKQLQFKQAVYNKVPSPEAFGGSSKTILSSKFHARGDTNWRQKLWMYVVI